MDYLKLPLAKRIEMRRKNPEGLRDYPESYGGIFTREGKPLFHPMDPADRFSRKTAWIEPDAIGARWRGPADKFARINHNGWYTDNSRFETTRGVVYRLPHGRFLAGASDPWNCDKEGFGPFITEGEVFTDEIVAARAADSLAESYGEFLREDDAKQQAEFQIEEKKGEIASLRESIRGLIAGIREPKLAPAVCSELRDSIRRHWKEMTKARKRIHALRKNYWLTVE